MHPYLHQPAEQSIWQVTLVDLTCRIERTNEGFEVTFGNGRRYDVFEDGDGNVVCRLIAGTLLLHPYATSAKGVLEGGVIDEIEKCADIYWKRSG